MRRSVEIHRDCCFMTYVLKNIACICHGTLHALVQSSHRSVRRSAYVDDIDFDLSMDVPDSHHHWLSLCPSKSIFSSANEAGVGDCADLFAR